MVGYWYQYLNGIMTWQWEALINKKALNLQHFRKCQQIAHHTHASESFNCYSDIFKYTVVYVWYSKEGLLNLKTIYIMINHYRKQEHQIRINSYSKNQSGHLCWTRPGEISSLEFKIYKNAQLAQCGINWFLIEDIF